MNLDWTPFVEFVHAHQRFLITTHIRPDGDGLGSQLALGEILENMGKEVQLVIASSWPPRYNFMDPHKRIERFASPGDRWREVDAVLILDTGSWGQLGDLGPFLKTLRVPKLVIDHHVSQDDLGAFRLVDTSAEATGRLVFQGIAALGAKLTPGAANHLFVAVAMDTGWFRHANTTAATFALLAELVQAGAQPTVLYDHLFEENTLPRMRLTGLVLDRLQTAANGRIAYTEIRRGDYQATGAVPQDSEDLVNYTRSLAGVEVGLFFMEQPAGGVKVSFRSRPGVDVARLAERFGGGGHRQASGAVLPGTLDEARSRVLAAVQEVLSQPKVADSSGPPN